MDQLSADEAQDSEFIFELAMAYDEVGRIQGDPHYTNLGDLEGTTQSYQKAVDLLEEIWKKDPSNIRFQHALASSYGRLAVAKSWAGAQDSSIMFSERGVALLQTLDMKAEPTVQHDLGRMLSELGWYWIWQGKKA